jgi:hypothetical protein
MYEFVKEHLNHKVSPTVTPDFPKKPKWQPYVRQDLVPYI